MCGIIAGFSKKGKRISKSIMKRYEAQKHRGSQGFGYVAFYKDGNGGRISVGRSVDEKGIRTQIMNENSSMIMFHHRLPTSTPNVEEATHPIFVSHAELDFDYFVVHNGVIRNSDELRKRHEALGYVYNTVVETEVVTKYTAKSNGAKYYLDGTKTEKFNDSESLAIEVARAIDGMSSRIDTVGTVATIAWKVNKETGKLISISYGHNSGNPMTISDNNDHFFLSSLGGTDLPEDILYTLSTDGDTLGTTTQREISVGFNTEFTRTNGSNSYKYTYVKPAEPILSLPEKKVGNEVKKPFTYAGVTYESYQDYVETRFGFNPAKRDNWDKEDGMFTKKFGFDTEGIGTKSNDIDTTEDTNGNYFMETSGEMVKAYLELEDLRHQVMGDIDAGEYLLRDKTVDNWDKRTLAKDVKDSEEKLEVLQQQMNDIEDKYTELFPSRSAFKVLVDAYVEQGADEFEGILYDIQLDESAREYELGKVI